MINGIDDNPLLHPDIQGDVFIDVASSEALPHPSSSVDFILSSPPYCTRIDYAVASLPELALFGYVPEGDFQLLRKKLIGTSTVPTVVPEYSPYLGTNVSEIPSTAFVTQIQGF